MILGNGDVNCWLSWSIRVGPPSYNEAMNLDAALDRLAHDPSTPLDIAEVSLYLARDEYPELDVEAHLAEIDGMAHEARSYLRGALESRVAGLCRYLFHEMGFRGNQRDYYDPRNSYLNQVLERRTGIPISLSAVVMAVGARAGMTIQGIGLPGHFVVKAVDDGQQLLFDPFHGGRQLTTTDCENLVLQVTRRAFTATPEQLRAVPLGLIVGRMLSNLKGIYLQQGDLDRSVRVMQHLCRLQPHELAHRRDLGATLLQAGLPGKAIDHLAAYVDALPQANDAVAVQQMLGQARAQVAGWN